MRTAAWETAPPIALRHCSREAAGKDSIYVILVMGAYMQSNIFFQKVSASQVKLSASHETDSCHHEEFECFSRYEEIKGFGS